MLLTWKEAKKKLHDASGVEKPENYMWEKNANGVFYPVFKELVAKLVYVSLVTRVVVEEGATEKEILRAAEIKFMEKVATELGENLDEIIDDIECPYEG